MIDLLQMADTAVQAAAQTVSGSDANGDGKLSLVELLTMGGWIMIPLLLLFLITIFCVCRALPRHSAGQPRGW